MPDVQGFLTRKAGPLPVWGWAAIGGGLVTVLYLRGKGQSSSAPAGAPGADSSGQGLFAPSPIIVTPSSMPASTSSANPPPPATPGTGATVTLQGRYGIVWLWSQPARTGLVATLPNGTSLPSAGPPVQGQNFSDAGVTSNMWTPVKYATGTAYAWAPEAQASGGGAGGGGAASVIKTLPGAGRVGRFSSRHAHPQFVNVGMGGGGRHALRAISQRTGLPEARLMALNPGHWRPTPGGQPRHIHIR